MRTEEEKKRDREYRKKEDKLSIGILRDEFRIRELNRRIAAAEARNPPPVPNTPEVVRLKQVIAEIEERRIAAGECIRKTELPNQIDLCGDVDWGAYFPKEPPTRLNRVLEEIEKERRRLEYDSNFVSRPLPHLGSRPLSLSERIAQAAGRPTKRSQEPPRRELNYFDRMAILEQLQSARAHIEKLIALRDEYNQL